MAIYSHYVYRWLAEPDDGPEDNYFIVNQLLARRSEKAEKFGEELEGPHWDDEWWIGAKSYVGFQNQPHSKLQSCFKLHFNKIVVRIKKTYLFILDQTQ